MTLDNIQFSRTSSTVDRERPVMNPTKTTMSEPELVALITEVAAMAARALHVKGFEFEDMVSEANLVMMKAIRTEGLALTSLSPDDFKSKLQECASQGIKAARRDERKHQENREWFADDLDAILGDGTDEDETQSPTRATCLSRRSWVKEKLYRLRPDGRIEHNGHNAYRHRLCREENESPQIAALKHALRRLSRTHPDYHDLLVEVYWSNKSPVHNDRELRRQVREMVGEIAGRRGVGRDTIRKQLSLALETLLSHHEIESMFILNAA
jgi:hypothetical protein